MLAFDVYVYRLPEGDPPEQFCGVDQTKSLDQEDLIARWTVSAIPGCLAWIDVLVEQGKAEQRIGTGYPMLYIGETEAIVAAMQSEIEITPKIAEKLQASKNDEALVVEAWDLS
jgi:hypothetical protein